MNTGSLVRRVQTQFGDFSGKHITREMILEWLNDAQLDIVKKTKALEKHVKVTSIEGDGSYELPDAFVAIRSVQYDGNVLQATKLEDIDQMFPDRHNSEADVKGVPSFYYVFARNLWVYPVPDGTKTLSVYYVKAPATLVNDEDEPEIPFTMHLAMVRYALSKAKEFDDSPEQAIAIMADYEISIAQDRNDYQEPEQHTYPAIRSLPGDD